MPVVQVTQFAVAFVPAALGIFVVRSRPHSSVNRAFGTQAMLFPGWVLGIVVEPSTLLTDLVAIHAPAVEDKDMLGDRGQLIQLSLNLLKNAVEAMPQGGTVMIRCIESTEPVTVQVLDEGVGFPFSLRANIVPPASSGQRA